MFLRFIQPASPRRRDRQPVGNRWIHEVKFDGLNVPCAIAIQASFTKFYNQEMRGKRGPPRL